ncbi:hypothetical protein M422DRAFT_273750, partial [Sphaerobolus stellatus SS14]
MALKSIMGLVRAFLGILQALHTHLIVFTEYPSYTLTDALGSNGAGDSFDAPRQRAIHNTDAIPYTSSFTPLSSSLPNNGGITSGRRRDGDYHPAAPTMSRDSSSWSSIQARETHAENVGDSYLARYPEYSHNTVQRGVYSDTTEPFHGYSTQVPSMSSAPSSFFRGRNSVLAHHDYDLSGFNSPHIARDTNSVSPHLGSQSPPAGHTLLAAK